MTVIAAIGGIVVASGPAWAHQASVAYSTVTLDADRTSLTYQLRLDPIDAAEMLGFEPDAELSDDAVAAGRGVLLDRALGRIAVTDGDTACRTTRGQARRVTAGSRFVELDWRVDCAGAIRSLVIDYDLLFDEDPLHQGLLRVTYRDRTASEVLRDGRARFVWDLGEPPPTGHTDFLLSGIDHIVQGFDHVAFVLGLLLIVVIARERGTVPGGRWRIRDLAGGLRYTAGIVSSFTLAHSITLIAASLDLVSLPSRPVECLIALSIVYIAVENVIAPDTRRRYAVTFAFGLIHGLGFASMLQVLLPPDGVVGPLLMFNLGVELGQLAIVLCVLPLLHATARALGASRYRSTVLPVGSGTLALAGLAWLVERVFEVTILGF